MKKEIKIGSFFRGNEKYGEELIKAFKDAGGENIVEYNGRDETQIYYLTEKYQISRAQTEVIHHLFLAKSPENEITIDDLREDEDMTRPQFPSIFKVVPCISFTPLISPEDGEEYAYILTKEQMKTIDETLKELL
ncbi:hypothetical protein [Ihuprevotella massiliensis]|jgi:hypothetical protein|uniref:hypothetical protein n=1 Tax=Ihuprevotella massiliensis TaxID=1852368 RepID=UPI00094E7F85